MRGLGLKPPPTAAEAFAASFDDEQTNVLGGEESFVDLGMTRQDQRSPASESSKEPSVTQAARSDAALASSVTAFRVAIVADRTGVQILPLKPGESAGADVPTAFIVPSDAVSSEAISQLLGRGGDK